jgi:Ca2+-binding RTX toxin-like protein
MAVFTNSDDGTALAPVTSGDLSVYLLDGNDFFDSTALSSGGQSVYGGFGNDTIAIGNLFGILFGDVGHDTLTGNAQIDFLDGGIGNDTMSGAGGHDQLYGDEGNDSMFGGAGEDRLYGNDGADVLDGGGDSDRMSGDDGDDTYYVREPGDRVLEHANEGTDWADASVSYTLPANVENLQLTGGSVNGAGNGLANLIVGSPGANVMWGVAGNDTLNGRFGNDTLRGGLGKDILEGGGNRDFFDFDAVKESARGANRDVILDLIRAEDDRIDLRTIDANTHKSGNQGFHFIGVAAFHGSEGELRCKSGIVQGDVNGDRKADFDIKVNLATLVAGDFFF